jgi:uncharacterized membrane protein
MEVKQMEQVTQNRFKSPVFWLSILGIIVNLLVHLEVIPIDTKSYIDEFLVAITCLIFGFSSSNNPTNKKGY